MIRAFAVLIALALVPSIGAAQTSAPGSEDAPPRAAAPSIETTVEALARTIASQQKLLEEQGRQIEQLRREIADARGLTPPASAPQGPSTQSSPPQQAVASQPLPASGDQSGKRESEVPPDLVTVEEFPGAFRVPGSDAALKIGGLVRVNWVSTYDPLLVDDRFQTSAIPVAGSVEGSKPGRVNVIASPSRFNFDLRTPTGVGYMRAFIEGDFAGNNNTLRLRHAYGQWRRFIFGQTWSTFSDPDAEPDGIDFEGLNAIVLFRQPQIRWSFPLADRFRMAFALEDPRPDLTGATGINQIPDVVTRVRFEPRRGGHVQLSGVVRQLRGEPLGFPEETVAATGYGINISGRLPLKLLNERDQFLFQHNSGRGLGRYISDLGSYGGQDGVFDVSTHTLHALDVFSGYVGFEHWWNEQWRSAASFGIVGINNPDFQPGDALHRTRRGTINFMWSPIPRLDLVTEFLWGDRQNKDGQTGFAAQTQMGSTFRF
jgi:hypothetical protein